MCWTWVQSTGKGWDRRIWDQGAEPLHGRNRISRRRKRESMESSGPNPQSPKKPPTSDMLETRAKCHQVPNASACRLRPKLSRFLGERGCLRSNCKTSDAVLSCPDLQEAILIDPEASRTERDLELIEELRLIRNVCQGSVVKAW